MQNLVKNFLQYGNFNEILYYCRDIAIKSLVKTPPLLDYTQARPEFFLNFVQVPNFFNNRIDIFKKAYRQN